MQKTQIVYKGIKPKANEIAEIKELMLTLDSIYTRVHPSEIKTSIDPIYKIERIDWDWFKTLFEKDNDISCLVLEKGDLSGVGITDHWGFYSLDDDQKHQFYITYLPGTLEARASTNGFKSNLAWMFVHEYLHGAVWMRCKDRDIAGSIVHKWEAEGTLKQHLIEDNNYYQLLETQVTQKTEEVVTLKSMKTLQIYRPMISSKITQHFGENGACIDTTEHITNAIRNGVCKPGTVLFYTSIGMLGHNGMDIQAIMGEDIYHGATYNGWMKVEHDNAGGIGVDVVSNEPLFFTGPIHDALKDTAVPVDGGFMHHVLMRYWHLKAPVGFDGKQVTCGTTIGLAGMSGAASGPHLHFAFKFCCKDGRSVDNDNGWNGAQDPEPCYDNSITAKDHAKYMLGSAPQPTLQETKDMLAQLSLMQMMLVTLQKTVHNI